MCDEVCQQDVESASSEGLALSRSKCGAECDRDRAIAMLAGREALINNGDIKEARIHQLETEVAMLREELRINGAPYAAYRPASATQYTSSGTDGHPGTSGDARLDKAETARRFFVSDDTIRAWLRRADDDSLVDTHTSVNRFPEDQVAVHGLFKGLIV